MPHQDVPSPNRRLGKAMRQRLTPAELALWKTLRNRGLENLRFRRQAPLGPFIVDFFCPEAKLAVEVDGGQHFRHRGREDDLQRDAWPKAHGVTVIRFTNQQVLRNIQGVCDAILAATKSA